MGVSIRDQLIDSSRQIADMVITYIGTDQGRFDEAVYLSLEDTYPISMRAARLLQIICEKKPEMIWPHTDVLVDSLSSLKIDGVKRSFLKILSHRKLLLKEEKLGILTDICFNLVNNEKEAIAVRAFAIDNLIKVSKTYSEIIPELIAILESLYPDGSKGLKSKYRKTIKILKNKKRD